MTKTILTITYSNLDKTDGPVIHFMELWNSFTRQFGDEFNVQGLGCVTRTGTPLLIENNFSLKTIPSDYPRPIRLLMQDLYFAFEIFRHRHDIVYLRTGNNMCFTVLAAAFLRVDLFTEYNGIASLDAESNRKGSFFRRFVAYVERRAIRSSKGCIGVSNGIKQFLERSGGSNVERIKNGVAPAFFNIRKQSAEGRRPSIVYVGTFTPWDGAADVVKLAAQFPDVDFHLVGDGVLRKSVETSAVSSNVFFKGFVKYTDLPDEYAQHDAGIVLYEVERNMMELSSLKTLEYAAAGLPIFSTRVPGQEFIETDGLGILADENDIAAAFGSFLDRLPELQKNADKFRRTNGKVFSWDRAAVETRSFIVKTVA